MRRKEGRGGGWERDSEGRSGWKPKKVEGSGSFCFPDLLYVADDEMVMMPMRGEGESDTRFLLSLVMTKAKMLQMMVYGGCSERLLSFQIAQRAAASLGARWAKPSLLMSYHLQTLLY